MRECAGNREAGAKEGFMDSSRNPDAETQPRPSSRDSFLRSLWAHLRGDPKEFLLIVPFAFLSAVTLMAALAALVLLPLLPSIDKPEKQLELPMRIYSADGSLIADFGEKKRLPVAIDDVPAMMIKAILAAEDRSFFYHGGVDYLGMMRAARANLQSESPGQGASTITMQVARNYFLSPEKTYTRKLQEVLLAFALERDRSKQEILELYVNKVFLGQRAYGFAAAAQIYYGSTLQDLSLSQMAMLAGLPKAPSRDNPLNNPRAALERRNHVLRNMHSLGHIDRATLETVLASPETARLHALRTEVEAPHLAEEARQYVLARYKDRAYIDGLHVYTTIDVGLQRAANAALRQHLLEYDRRHGYRGAAGHVALPDRPRREQLESALKEYRPVAMLIPGIVTEVGNTEAAVYHAAGEIVTLPWKGLAWARRYYGEDAVGPWPTSTGDVLRRGDIIYLERVAAHDTEGVWWRLAQVPKVTGALVALRPSDGAIVALAGGFDFFHNNFNHATQAERQPGSSFKPFVYTAALAKGYTAATMFSGAPIVLSDPVLEAEWRPEDYTRSFYGPTRLRRALARSLNLVSLRVLRATGVPYTVDYLERFGFDARLLPHDLSLALGTISATPVRMAGAYAVFANGGYLVEPYFISRIEDVDHRVLEEARPTVVCGDCDRKTVALEPAFGGLRPRARPAIRVLTPEINFLMTSMMNDVIREGTAHAAAALGRADLAGKTGTTNDFRDAWFSGFNSDLVATAWVGFDEATSLGREETGARAALPIWTDFMRVALDGVPEKPLAPPTGIVKIATNRSTGLPAHARDNNPVEEYFVRGTELQTQGPMEEESETRTHALMPTTARRIEPLPRNVWVKLF
jgi:penicillin-binding protein 1A